MILKATVRYREDTFELRCERCAALRKGNRGYWPLTLEFWNPKRSMTKCRACLTEVTRQTRRIEYAANAAVREKATAYARAQYASLSAQEKAVLREKQREQRRRWENAWRAERQAHLDTLKAPEDIRAYKRDWMRQQRAAEKAA